MSACKGVEVAPIKILWAITLKLFGVTAISP